MASKVQLYVYDLSRGMAKTMSLMFLGKQINGIWHTAVVVFGREYFFGGMAGIESCLPGTLQELGHPTTIKDMGNTEIPEDMFLEYLKELSQDSFRGDRYHLLDHNCNSFSNELCQFLTGKSIPAEITSLPADVMSTPMGAMIRPLIDAMQVTPAGATPIGETLGQIQSRAPASSNSGKQLSSNNCNSSNNALLHPHDVEVTEQPVRCLGVLSAEFEAVLREISSSLNTTEQQCVTELIEYARAQESPSWALSRQHARVVVHLMAEAEPVMARTALLAALVECSAREDCVWLLRAVGQELMQRLRVFTDTEEGLLLTAKLLVNCAAFAIGRDWLLAKNPWQSSEKKDGNAFLSCKVCVLCLLHENTELGAIGLRLAHNLSYNKLAEESSLEMGSALLQYVQQGPATVIGDLCAPTLDRMLGQNSELSSLARVLGLNVEQLAAGTVTAQRAKRSLLMRLSQ